MKNTKTNESGRSMVEMLGVLAVMGVLSVAGIAAYTTAMQSYRANEAIHAISMLYVLAMAKNAGNGPTENVTYVSENGSNPSGVSDLQYDATNKNIRISFNNAKDCAMAKNKLGDKAPNDCNLTEGKYNLTVNFGEAVGSSCNPWESEVGGSCTCDDSNCDDYCKMQPNMGSGDCTTIYPDMQFGDCGCME